MKYKIRQQNKYNSSERNIAFAIKKFKDGQKYCFEKWHEYDMKIMLIKKELKGKYHEKPHWRNKPSYKKAYKKDG